MTVTGIGNDEIDLIATGRHRRLWQALGAHPVALAEDGQSPPATSFRVWAPAARAVEVVWTNGQGTTSAGLSRIDDRGLWGALVPGAGPGDRYQYRIVGPDGIGRMKADPVARATAPGEPHLSVVADPSRFEWSDGGWLAERRGRRVRSAPMSVYELHVGSWRPGSNYRHLADALVPYIRDRGFTHVELMPVMEHPYGGSWGYQVSSYFAPSARYGAPDDLRELVDRLHRAGIGVILDWVPAHFARDEWSLFEFDGAPLYEPDDPLRANHPAWGTRTFDYSRAHVRDFLISSARYWVEEFHADALRVDAVSSMTRLDFERGPGQWRPNPDGGVVDHDGVGFLQELTSQMRLWHPDVVLVAEEAGLTPGVTGPVTEGGLGFDLIWDLGWAHDTVACFGAVLSGEAASVGTAGGSDADDRFGVEGLAAAVNRAHQQPVTLPISHDEVDPRRGSLWSRLRGDGPAAAAAQRAFLGLQWATPGKKLLFMGCEFGQVDAWQESAPLRPQDVLRQPDGHLHRGLEVLVSDLNRLYQALPALHDDTHERALHWWRRPAAGHRTFAFVRGDGGGQVLLCAVNLAADPATVDLPSGPGTWWQVLDTADERYGARDRWLRRPGRTAVGAVELMPSSVVWLVAGIRRPDAEPGQPVSGGSMMNGALEQT